MRNPRAGFIVETGTSMNVQPRRTGQLLVGSSRELVDWDDSLNRELCARMLRPEIIDFRFSCLGCLFMIYQRRSNAHAILA